MANLPVNVEALAATVKAAESAATVAEKKVDTAKAADPAVASTAARPALTHRLYKCTQRSMQCHTNSGRLIIFVNHKFVTDDAELISYLDDQLKRRAMPGIFIDADEPWYDPEKYDANLKMRNQIRAELIAEIQAEMAKATNPNNNMGTSVAGKLNPASTATIAPVAAGNGPMTVPMVSVTK